MNIEIPLDRILDERGRSFYWLAKETGMSYTTLWRLKSGKALGINFATLEKICEALDCTPGDVLKIGQKAPEASGNKRAPVKNGQRT
jgi:putative transcriptional regulator